MKDSQIHRHTAETLANTQAERTRQILRLQEVILLQEKAKREKAEKPYDPNAIMQDDNIPF